MDPDVDLYPDQIAGIAHVTARLDDQFAFAPGSYAPNGNDRRIFEAAVKAEFSKIDVKVEVRWEHRLSPDGTLTSLYQPQIELVGNLRDKETDHDRMKWGIQHGLADGQAGFIREDGTKHEEPIKKLII